MSDLRSAGIKDYMVDSLLTFHEWEIEFWRFVRRHDKRRHKLKWYLRVCNLKSRMNEMFDNNVFPKRAADYCVMYCHDKWCGIRCETRRDH